VKFLIAELNPNLKQRIEHHQGKLRPSPDSGVFGGPKAWQFNFLLNSIH
jgi:hypothetical protein